MSYKLRIKNGDTVIANNLNLDSTYTKTLLTSEKLLSNNIIFETYGVPSTYTELQYVTQPASSGCDLGIACKSTLVTKVKFKPTSIQGGLILGKVNTESNAFRFFGASSTWYLDFGSGGGYNRISGSTITTNTIYEVEWGNRYIKDLTTGSNIISSTAVSAFTKTYNYMIGGQSDANVFYYIQIYDDSTLIRDLVPVKRNSDSVAGFYDIVNNVFYPSSTSTSFIAGPAKEETTDLILYNEGDECTSVSGGWDFAYRYDTSSTITKNSDHMLFHYYWGAVLSHSTSIDLTNYTTAHIIAYQTTSRQENACFGVRLSTATEERVLDSNISTGSSYAEYTLDISSLSGSYCLCITGQYYLSSSGDIYIKKVWLT